MKAFDDRWGGRVLVMLFLLMVGVLNGMDWGMNEVWWLVGGGGCLGVDK